MRTNPQPRHLQAVPTIAWPTLLLAVLALAVWATGGALAVSGTVYPALGVLVAALGGYLAFTPLHEATHRAVAPKRRALNDWVGRVCALVLVAPFVAFRHEHLAHHRHTNEPGLDPDHWSGRGPAWLRPLRWATQDLHYYARVVRLWRQIPVAERRETVVSVALIAAAAGGVWAIAGGEVLLLGWIVPARLAIFLLAFSFDYLPHRPHRVTAAENRYLATRIVDSRVLEVVLLAQNYHLIHHLYPAVPFYRYRQVWAAEEHVLREKGAPITRLPL